MKFLDFFPNHKYRYIKKGEPAEQSDTLLPELNKNGYESYFTVNGFATAHDNKKEQCTNINSFFIDIDGRKDPDELARIEARLAPTFIIETGHGYHIYWVLDEQIYKEDLPEEEWNAVVARWERIEESVVTHLKADPPVKDITRILRVPDTQYWKEGGGKTKIKGVFKKEANRYSIDAVEEAFPLPPALSQSPKAKQEQKYAEDMRRDYWTKVDTIYPMESRPSFVALTSGEVNTLPPDFVDKRNMSLLVTATLMREAGWDKPYAIAQISKVGWHGMEKEKGGMQEIVTTINSAYAGGYRYNKHPVIEWNTTREEQNTLQEAKKAVNKGLKEMNKFRFSEYEKEVLTRYPNLLHNEVGVFYNYDGGVYKAMTDQEINNLILNELDKDMLTDFRTKKNIADKVACLISITPILKVTDDRGRISNVKNGLLDIVTRELKPHTPEYVSLSQSDASYDSGAVCPVWDSCIGAWMMGEEKEEKKILLQQFSGYCLSSTMNQDKALFLLGDGGNGKSTFVEAISMVIGKEATSHVDLEELYRPFGMKGIIGKRLNIIEEVHDNFYASNKLKKLISGEPVTIDQKYKDQYTFYPETKFVFAVNILPRVSDTSMATERRMSVIKFSNHFRGSLANTNLRGGNGLLAQELSGILNWMLEGALLLKEKGKLVVTQEQIALLHDYRTETSSVAAFEEDCLDYKEGLVTSSDELYENYREYCKRSGRAQKTNRSFTRELASMGKLAEVFTFKARERGGDPSSFEGVVISDYWKKARLNPSYEFAYFKSNDED